MWVLIRGKKKRMHVDGFGFGLGGFFNGLSWDSWFRQRQGSRIGLIDTNTIDMIFLRLVLTFPCESIYLSIHCNLSV